MRQELHLFFLHNDETYRFERAFTGKIQQRRNVKTVIDFIAEKLFPYLQAGIFIER